MGVDCSLSDSCQSRSSQIRTQKLVPERETTCETGAEAMGNPIANSLHGGVKSAGRAAATVLNGRLALRKLPSLAMLRYLSLISRWMDYLICWLYLVGLILLD